MTAPDSDGSVRRTLFTSCSRPWLEQLSSPFGISGSTVVFTGYLSQLQSGARYSAVSVGLAVLLMSVVFVCLILFLRGFDTILERRYPVYSQQPVGDWTSWGVAIVWSVGVSGLGALFQPVFDLFLSALLAALIIGLVVLCGSCWLKARREHRNRTEPAPTDSDVTDRGYR